MYPNYHSVSCMYLPLPENHILTWLHIAVYHPFVSIWRTSFSPSHGAGLAVKNSLSFCLSGKVFQSCWSGAQYLRWLCKGNSGQLCGWGYLPFISVSVSASLPCILLDDKPFYEERLKSTYKFKNNLTALTYSFGWHRTHFLKYHRQ